MEFPDANSGWILAVSWDILESLAASCPVWPCEDMLEIWVASWPLPGPQGLNCFSALMHP